MKRVRVRNTFSLASGWFRFLTVWKIKFPYLNMFTLGTSKYCCRISGYWTSCLGLGAYKCNAFNRWWIPNLKLIFICCLGQTKRLTFTDPSLELVMIRFLVRITSIFIIQSVWILLTCLTLLPSFFHFIIEWSRETEYMKPLR